ncbi:MAG: phage tail protein I [Marinovum sp.]|nr:phage tail protein I [Marinovum sp.]
MSSLIPPSLVSPGVADDRQHALAQLFGEALAEIDVARLVTSDPMSVDARLLPFMIREFGAQDYIDPDLPELVQRRILKHIWQLKELHGYDAGVKLGLQLLGMSGQIEHWWQVEPKRQANTHIITVDINEILYPDEGGHFSDRQVAAIWKMINGTKRHSQGTELRVGVAASAKTFVGVYLGTRIRATAPAIIPPPPVVTIPANRALVPTAYLAATARALS